MDELIVENEKLVYYVLKRLGLYHLKDDLYDIGIIGLIRASRSYDEKKGNFSTYACKCIKNEIFIEMRKQNNGKRKAILVPLTQEVYKNLTLEDTIPSDVDLENDFIKKEQLKSIYDVMKKLDKQKRELMIKYFGLNGKKATQKQLSEEYKISQPQVCRIVQRTINKIRKEVK